MSDERDMLFECQGCKRINVFPEHMKDGANCMVCGSGSLIAKDHVMVYRENSKGTKLNDITVNVKVDTTEIDKVLEKMKELLGLTEHCGNVINNQEFTPETHELISMSEQEPLNNITVNINNNTDTTSIHDIAKQLMKLQMRSNRMGM